MARLSFIVGSILFSWSSAIADAQTIPLDQIWAYEMPGTRDIAELSKTPQDRLVDDIFMAQFSGADRMFFKNVARPGFAVAGIGREQRWRRPTPYWRTIKNRRKYSQQIKK